MSKPANFTVEKEEEVYSLEHKKEAKLRDFREYLVDKNVVLAFSKFLLSVRNSPYKPENPFEVMKEFFGVYKSESMIEYENLQNSVNNLAKDNEDIVKEIADLRKKIEDAKEAKKKKEELEAQMKAEEEAKKNTKKPAKK